MGLNKEFTKQQILGKQKNKKYLADQKISSQKKWQKWPILQEI